MIVSWLATPEPHHNATGLEEVVVATQSLESASAATTPALRLPNSLFLCMPAWLSELLYQIMFFHRLSPLLKGARRFVPQQPTVSGADFTTYVAC
mmetsp:Transcript_23058/g.44828  ORF Transcript_23058/g.44828 Transcript_23058/m.44828 type:complete len:95 (-) Transcript_23058:191-475(-)